MLAILAMAAALTSADNAAAKNRADLDVLYSQSCKVRAYGSYDEMCNKLRKRMKEFEREQAKASKTRRNEIASVPAVETPTSEPAPTGPQP